MKRLFRLYFLFTAFFLILSCTSSYHLTNSTVTQYHIKPNSLQDTSLSNMLKPYYGKMAATMERVIAVSDVELLKKQPDCNLGNLMADIIKETAEKEYTIPIDIAMMNYGGIRLTAIPPGNITVGKVFELSPFDNLIVVLKLNGKTLQQFVDHIASGGGASVGGATFSIKNKKAVNIVLGGKPFDENATYFLATIDYIANGGDDADMLRGIPQMNKQVVIRDAIIAYLEKLTANGKHIADISVNRITNVE
ncbi:MAG: 5'-nucleotidase C-terminal domain-containing protein [Sphingobacteriales bacterium]